MPTYKLAWRAFRELSDENEKTAEHLRSRSAWPAATDGNPRILDLGCGDGRLVEAVASRAAGCSISLVDPDKQMLDESVTRLGALRGINLATHNERAEDVVADLSRETDLALAVHLLYLLDINDSRTLVDRLAPGTPYFFVLDDPASVFTTLWERTAPKYFSRVHASHELLSNLPGSFRVSISEFDSHLGDPFVLPSDIAAGVLSLLCYADYPQLQPDLRAWVDQTVRERTVGGVVNCRCRCYQVVRIR